MHDYEKNDLREEFYGTNADHTAGADLVLVRIYQYDRPVVTEELTGSFEEYTRHHIKYRTDSLAAAGYIEIEHRGVDEHGRNRSKRYVLKPPGRRVVEEFLMEEPSVQLDPRLDVPYESNGPTPLHQLRRDINSLEEAIEEQIRWDLKRISSELSALTSNQQQLRARIDELEQADQTRHRPGED